MRTQIKTTIILVLLLALSACHDTNLQTLAKALDDTAHGVAVLQSTVIEANAQHLISDDATRGLMEFSIKINAAGQDAVAATRKINSLSDADRQKLQFIILPIIQTLSDGQVLASTIGDAATHQRVVAALALIQLSLNSANLVLAGR